MKTRLLILFGLTSWLIWHGIAPSENDGIIVPVAADQSDSETAVLASISGEMKTWYPLTLSFNGPDTDELAANPNPFTDYRLQVTFTGPQGQIYEVPGFYAGDGNGGGAGSVWQVIFSPDKHGVWSYEASFRTGDDVAVDLDPLAGTAVHFDGETGQFSIDPVKCNAPGFLGLGRLEYANNHYLKFRDGGYWIKGGTDSPENFFGYHGFDNTIDQGGLIPDFLHVYSTHVADWQPGDPNFVSEDSGADAKGIIGALNYLSEKRVNSIYFLPMNLGGDGQETYPFVAADGTAHSNTHYDISKLRQWQTVLEHAQRKGIAIQMVLAETEVPNYNFLDDGGFGVERKLFFREMIARFGHLLGLKWNLSEENRFPVETLRAYADYIQALDWAQHPIAAHTYLDTAGSPHYSYADMLGDSRFSATSFQYKWETADGFVEVWRANSANAGRPWVLDMDENNNSLTSSNEDVLRKSVLYQVYFSGGNIEWYMGYWDLPLGGDMRLEDFSTREKMWDFTWYARRFMQENLPFWEMQPADNLLSDEAETYNGGQVFAKIGEVYAIHLPDASQPASLDLTAVSGTFTQQWFNPRTGEFEGAVNNITGGGIVSLGLPPNNSSEDWVILLKNTSNPGLRIAGVSPFITYLPLIAYQCDFGY
ncbi:DUF5060 domain-containing protein [Candidatus Leptofilum sp.]|uniref:DUF5060 domain-containing protein n=1 Tax=Candidatus Leptofilum sp. TaxID=3241576 RepID=UPI003B5A4153